MSVNFILNIMKNPNMNLILFSEVIRSKRILKLNEIFNQALLKNKKEEIGIYSRPTIFSLLVYLLSLIRYNFERHLAIFHFLLLLVLFFFLRIKRIII